ncbi:hypothetical protein AAF712_004760 [Marasmius tenuissimus]|uniref:Zn(2)-C6 fungal-type domain-containing protein n=1 Tax=Marasmius tenuissimus TaxID=585030 RepID=A0ABR3A2B1_9AGAR
MTGQISNQSTTSATEKTAPQKFIFKQPSQHLRRGKACLCCRLHKIKCDGAKPVCGPCLRAPKETECSYTDHPTRTKILEQSVARLQARVRELEASGGGNSSNSSSEGEQVEAVNISPSFSPHIPEVEPSFTRSDSAFDIHSFNAYGDIFNTGFDTMSLEVPPEPSPSVIEALLDNFLPHAIHFGFFLHPYRFRTSALLLLPFGDSNRPAPALLTAAYLWGIHLSQDQLFKSYEPIFLQRALNHISISSSSADYDNAYAPTRIIHTIQAQVLLSTYFFRTNRFLEADIHINSAISLCLSSGLHKLRSQTYTPTVLGVFGGREAYLGPPRDFIEEGERIGAFWTVFSVQRCLTVALGTSSASFGMLEDPDTQIDTPWPLGIEEYEKGNYSPESNGFRTIDMFVRGESADTYLNMPAYFKGVVLLQKAFCLCRRFRAGLASNELDAFTAKCNALERSISRFQATLPPLDDDSLGLGHDNSPGDGSQGSRPTSSSPSMTESQRQTLALTYALTTCAYLKIQTIFFHCGSLHARTRALAVAHSITQIIQNNLRPGNTYLIPILGTIVLVACQTFADELERMKNGSKGQGEVLGLGLQGLMQLNLGALSAEQERDKMGLEETVRAALEAGFNAMRLLAAKCPLAEYQFKKFQDVYKYTGTSRANQDCCHPGQV